MHCLTCCAIVTRPTVLNALEKVHTHQHVNQVEDLLETKPMFNLLTSTWQLHSKSVGCKDRGQLLLDAVSNAL